jgi:hypothetical protein
MLIDLIKHKEPIIFALFIFVRKYVTFYMSIFITNKYESLYLINHLEKYGKNARSAKLITIIIIDFKIFLIHFQFAILIM